MRRAFMVWGALAALPVLGGCMAAVKFNAIAPAPTPGHYYVACEWQGGGWIEEYRVDESTGEFAWVRTVKKRSAISLGAIQSEISDLRAGPSGGAGGGLGGQ